MRCATQGEKAAITKELCQEGYKLSYVLKAIELPRSTYYYELKKTDTVSDKNAEISKVIIEIFYKHKGRYGVRRVHHELLNRDYKINHKRVQRLMHEMKLFGRRPKENYHSYKGCIGKVADNIINRNFTADEPFKKWTTDVSQFKFSWGRNTILFNLCPEKVIALITQ